ncbi:MAG: hypothetical protein M0P74_05370 [Syntrophales bacterium]|jgi:DNA-damage-inducible protein D|nr:hypothetical protein [Syntrophales bacterium]
MTPSNPDYRNFEGVVEKAKLSCFNRGHRIEDHFVDVTEMIEIGKGGQRPVKTILLSRSPERGGNVFDFPGLLG